MLEHRLQPQAPFTRSNDPWPSRCMTCGDHVSPTYNDVNSGKSKGGCSCRGRRIGDQLGLPAKDAEKIMTDWGWTPLEPYPSAGAAWSCECVSCGAVHPKMLSHVQTGDGGCRSCAGLDISDDQAR